jgi:ABC-type multidrug transport system fused ATPase/permease subunit
MEAHCLSQADTGRSSQTEHNNPAHDSPSHSSSITGTTLEIPPYFLGQIPKGEWPLAPKVRDINQQEFRSQLKRRELGVTWRDLTMEVLGLDTAINHNALSQFNFVNQLRLLQHKAANKVILKKSQGCVKPGEMLLVLGHPGAGCTTLLKLLANRRHGSASISGDIKFGMMDLTEAAEYQGQIVMNTKDEIFFPTLTVGDTINFATRMKIPFH